MPTNTPGLPEFIRVEGFPARVDLKFQHPKEDWDSFLGEKLGTEHYDTLLTEDADVYTPEGDLLLKFRRNCLNPAALAQAFKVLRTIEGKTTNRGIATGKVYSGKAIKGDGTLSNTHRLPHIAAVMSNVIGYYDRYIRIPYCRQTAFNADQPEAFTKVLPFLQSVAQVYKREAAARYALQQAVVDRTDPAWIIPGTPFTTITVNKNWQTAVHTDAGDLKDGLSCITAIRAGHFTGCFLIFPHYRIAVDLQNADLCLFDSHHMHGNTPLHGKMNQFERVSLVLYFREKMVKCLSPEAELTRAANRKPGDPLW